VKENERNIVIIGMPGVGKTTVGRQIAEEIGCRFFDTDELIEKNTGKTCAELINDRGEAAFREIEREITKLVMHNRGIVLSTGGGTPVYCGDILERGSYVIWLTRPLEEIAKVLDDKKRPLSTSLDDLKRLYSEREKYYTAIADLVFSFNDDVSEEAIHMTYDAICARRAKLLVLNGVNLNMLGIREPDIYGREDEERLIDFIGESANDRDIQASFCQFNNEGDFIDEIHDSLLKSKYDGIIINPGAWTHYSYAVFDALKAVSHEIPAVEVHISDIKSREAWRKKSVTAPACIGQITGRGFQGYADAMDVLLEHLHIEEYVP